MSEYKREMFGSVVLHLVLLGLLWLGESCTPNIRTPKPVTMVTAISLPAKKAANIPDRASQTKRPPKTESPTPPTPQTPPPPPKTDQMLLKEKEKPKEEPPKKEKKKPKEEPPKKEPPKDPPPSTKKEEREELLRKLQREQLLKDLNAPDGPVDRAATSKEGSEESTDTNTSVGPTDPVLSAYIQACRTTLLPNWTPLPTIIASHPEYEVVIKVQVAEDGKMSNPTILQKSGDSSFDRAAIMAVHKTGKLPPPPEKWKESAASGVIITLAAKDK